VIGWYRQLAKMPVRTCSPFTGLQAVHGEITMGSRGVERRRENPQVALRLLHPETDAAGHWSWRLLHQLGTNPIYPTTTSQGRDRPPPNHLMMHQWRGHVQSLRHVVHSYILGPRDSLTAGRIRPISA